MSPDPDVDAVVTAVLAVPGVVGLHGGAFGEVATYLPGRRVPGVRLDGARCELHVSLAWGSAVAETADQVREVVRPLVTGPVDVTVEDLVHDDGTDVSDHRSSEHPL